MFRRLISTTASLGVMTGLVAVGAVATAGTANATVPDGFFQVGDYDLSRDNPTLPARCGLDFGLVLDSSGSIGNGDNGMVALRKATNAFVESLVDTSSKVSVTSFSTVSPGLDNIPPNPPNDLTPGTNLVPTKLTSANLTAPIKASYENLWSSGWTNWQDGLQKSKNNFNQGSDPFSGGYPDLLIFITDGNPNTKNPAGDGGNALPDGSLAAVNPAIALANDMKANGVKTFGIAVGQSISLNPIKAITNEEAYTGTNFPTAGYVQTNDYTKLAEQLKELAVDLCAPSLTITKEVKTPANPEFVPADGWTFNTTVKIPDGTGKWVTPDKDDPIAQNTNSTKSVVTSGGGGATFQWEPNSDFTTKPVVISENLQGGYERADQLTCVAKNVLAGTQRELNPIVDANGNWTLDEIKAREIVTCTAQNTLTKLNLEKQVTSGPAGAGQFQLKATPINAPNAPVYDEPGDNKTFKPIAGDVTYELSETGPAGYSQDGAWVCTNGISPNAQNRITVPKGTQTKCTIKNKRDTASLKVTKVFDKPANLTLPNNFFKVDYTCTDGVKGTLEFNGSPTGESKSVVVPTGECSITEQPLAKQTGWTWGQPQYNPKSTEVKKDQTNELKVTNTITRDTGQLLLVKDVPEPTGSLTPEKWTLEAKNDTSPDKNYSEAGDNTEPQEVWAATPYTLSESPNAEENNYTASQWSCQIQDDDRVDTAAVNGILNGNVVKVPSNTTVVCTIVNTRNTAELKLVKKVEGKDPNAWTLTAKADDTEKQDLNVSNKGGEGDFEPVYAGTEYQLKEEGPGGYTPSDWQCELAPQDVEPGQVEEIDLKGDKITLEKGQRVTCTIINTRDLGSLTITKEFNPQQSGYTGTFDINYTCVDGAEKVKEGTVSLASGKSETITGLPTGTTCTVSEPTLPANPSGWTFNPPTFSPSNQATVTTKGQTVSVTVVNSVSQVSPVVVKKICPIDVTLHKPQPTKVGNKILTDKIKTKKSSCVLLKPVVLCRPIASSAAGETAFCDTKVTKKGRITVKTKGYDGVKVSVVVRTKPKPGFSDRWKPDTWRKSWKLT